MKYVLSIIVILLIISSLTLITFNPITNYFQIQHTKAILAKIKTYDNHQSAPPPTTRNLATWQGLNFDKTENNFIEKTGFNVVINTQSEYLGVIASGFDDVIFYNESQDCWYGNRIIVSLNICQNPEKLFSNDKS